MSKKTIHARVLAAIAAAGIGIGSLSGCTIMSTLADGGDDPETTTSTTPEPDPTESGDPVDTGDPDPTGSTGPEEDGQLTNFFDLKIGDCFDIPDDGDGQALLYSTCEVAHMYEAYSVAVMEGDSTFPGDDAVYEYADEVCNDAFQGYVGSNHGSSSFTYQYIVPSQGTWENMNDREILCTVTPKSGSTTTGSAENSRL